MKIGKLLKFIFFSKSGRVLRSKEGRHLAKTLIKSGIKLKKIKK